MTKTTMHPAEAHILKTTLAQRDDLPQEGWDFSSAQLTEMGTSLWIYRHDGEGLWLYCHATRNGWEYTTKVYGKGN